MKRASHYLIAGLVLVVLALGVALFRPTKPVSSGQLALPDGSLVRIVAVTYGTNHVVGPMLARLVDKWPLRAQALAKRLLGGRMSASSRMSTPEPRLVVWLDTNTAPANVGAGYFHAALADETGFVSGGQAYLSGWWRSLQGLSFQAVPRRDQHISLHFFHHRASGGVTNSGSLLFENPLYAAYPHWTPEVLPATKRVSDVEVTLNKLSTGHGQNTAHRGLPGGRKVIEFGHSNTDGRNRTVCLMSLRSLTDANEVWTIASVWLSDATGNRVKNDGMSWGGEGEDYFTFEPGLWTNESAWRLECEIKRTQRFGPEELLTFRGVPLGAVGATNRVGWSSNRVGVTVTVDVVVRRPPNTNNSWSSSEISQVAFTHSTLPTNTHLDLLTMVLDTGETNTPGSWSSSSRERTYSFRTIPLEARTADFTFVVHTSRWVEFRVKPEVRTARLEYPSPPGRK